MTIQLYIITHDQIGQELLNTVATMIDISKLTVRVISIPSDITADQQSSYAQQVDLTITKDTNNEKLILCDIYGATPYNLVKKYNRQENIKILTGLNLGMLLKATQMTQECLQKATSNIHQSTIKSIILE